MEGRAGRRRVRRYEPVDLCKKRVRLDLAPAAGPAREALARVDGEETADERPRCRRQVWVELHLLDVVLVRVPSAVGTATVQQLVDGDAEAPHVRRDAVVLAGPHLRRKVARRSSIPLHHVVVLLFQLHGQTEVAARTAARRRAEGAPGADKNANTHEAVRGMCTPHIRTRQIHNGARPEPPRRSLSSRPLQASPVNRGGGLTSGGRVPPSRGARYLRPEQECVCVCKSRENTHDVNPP